MCYSPFCTLSFVLGEIILFMLSSIPVILNKLETYHFLFSFQIDTGMLTSPSVRWQIPYNPEVLQGEWESHYMAVVDSGVITYLLLSVVI